jgi:outer membrane protein assembly factor BamB
VALDGYQRVGGAPLLARLSELGLAQGPWPAGLGPEGGRQRALLPGPAEGVQRWRLELPRDPVGRPLVDRAGDVVVRLDPSGLARISPDGRQARVIDWDWPVGVEPLLRGGKPVAFDPALGGLAASGEPAPKEPWPVFVDGSGWVFGLGPGRLTALGAAGELRWSRALARPRALAAAAGGPVHVVLADPVLGREDAFDHPGRLLVLDRDTGRTVRSHSEGRSLCGDGQLAVAVTADGTSVVQLGMDLFCDGPGGERRWQRRLEWSSPPAVGEDHVVLASTVGGVQALDLRTGDQRWRQPNLRTARGPALDVDGSCYVVGPGWFAGIGPEGALRFQLSIPVRGALGHVSLGYDRTAFFTVGRELVAVR